MVRYENDLFGTCGHISSSLRKPRCSHHRRGNNSKQVSPVFLVVVPSCFACYRCSNASERALFRYRYLETESQKMRCYHRLPHLANTVTPVRKHFLDIVISRLGACTHGGTITLRPQIHSDYRTRSDKECRSCSALRPGWIL